MNRRIAYCFFIALSFFVSTLSAQTLKPGFDANEYLEMLGLTAGYGNIGENIPQQNQYEKVYRSPETGLSNRCDVWVNMARTIMVISLRGTIGTSDSWLENFYTAMIPATGSLHLTDSTTFTYKFSADPKAAVHAGWTIGIGSLAPYIVQQIKKQYAKGIKQIIIIGHSQGGAMAFLLRSYLYYQVQDNQLPHDLVIKTYCSAAPKPGNLYYAYDFDFINRGGWAFTVVNAADWVPETPISLQTITDFNKINPFGEAHEILKKQKLFLRLYGGYVYNQLNRPSRRVQRRYKKYLGNMVYKQVKKYLPQYTRPKFVNTSNYTRAGTPIVLEPDADYYKHFPDTSSNIFEHHLFEPYFYLVKKYYPDAKE